jgi:hypothetical protein
MAEQGQMNLSQAWVRFMKVLGGPGRNSHRFKYQDGRALLVVFNNRMKRR